MDFKQGDLENIIMNAIWDLEEEGSDKIDVTEVQQKINTEIQAWAYTTVKTVLDRLVKKESLERIKFHKKFFYKSNISREQAGIKAIEKLCRQYFRDEMKNLIRTAEKIAVGELVKSR